MNLYTLKKSRTRRLHVESKLSAGGEGAVFPIRRNNKSLAKIYTDGKALERSSKISAMISAKLYKKYPEISFPQELVYDELGTFCGFTMARFDGVEPLHRLFDRRDRTKYFPKADTRFLVRTARNLAKSFATVHDSGCVVGDINVTDFLVGKNASIRIVDSDSFQFKANGTIHRCIVGTDDYLPPELQKVKARAISERLPDHDCFGLAVLVFQLLMLGRYPFDGIWNLSSTPPSRAERIIDRRYAYGTRSESDGIGPQPSAPDIQWLPDNIRDAFERAFYAISPSERPTATEWITLLEGLERQLSRCRRNRRHMFIRRQTPCPWCDVERRTGELIFFQPVKQFFRLPKLSFPWRQRRSRSGQSPKRGRGSLFLDNIRFMIAPFVKGLAAAAFIITMLLFNWDFLSGEVGSPFAPSWKYAWNMPTYHDGSGTVVATGKPAWAKEVELISPHTCTLDMNCFTMVIIFGENPDPIVPSEEQIQELFGDFLKGEPPLEIFAHAPFQRRGDLIRYEMPRQLWYGQLANTGYGRYDPDYSDATKKHVEAFIRSSSTGRVLDCYYQSEKPKSFVYHYMYWYKSRPLRAEPNRLRRQYADHPLLEISGPVDRCPSKRPSK